MIHFLKNSRILRGPLLAATRLLLRPLHAGWPLLRRAAYDAMPLPYLVTGDREQFVVSTADKVIGRELFLHGQFDFDKLELALAILKREGQVLPRHLIDVGANIGSITIPALCRGLFETATAIEPHPANLRLLRANLALNGVQERVGVLDIAVGEQTDVVLHLRESSTNSGNHTVGEEGLPIRSTRLDDLSLPLGHALLWMDIEGYEGHALAGAPALLASGAPVVLEFNPSYLAQSGGMDRLAHALQGRKIFDLKDPERRTSLQEVRARNTSSFTDVLAI
ncbi:MAG TPA: FkbM family methyltransferase [Burkholderiaceae bacterium]|nr:FkbM family methyltransferase [Burkholderiaceae bacterium]